MAVVRLSLRELAEKLKTYGCCFAPGLSNELICSSECSSGEKSQLTSCNNSSPSVPLGQTFLLVDPWAQRLSGGGGETLKEKFFFVHPLSHRTKKILFCPPSQHFLIVHFHEFLIFWIYFVLFLLLSLANKHLFFSPLPHLFKYF